MQNYSWNYLKANKLFWESLPYHCYTLLSGSLALETLLIGVHCKRRYVNVSIQYNAVIPVGSPCLITLETHPTNSHKCLSVIYFYFSCYIISETQIDKQIDKLTCLPAGGCLQYDLGMFRAGSWSPSCSSSDWYVSKHPTELYSSLNQLLSRQ